MKLRNFFYLLLALPLFIAGCTEQPEEPQPTPAEVNLELTSEATLTFKAEGGNGTIAYKLENAPEGAVATASCAAEWITDLNVGQYVTFVVERNEGEARNAKIVVSYSDKYFEVAIQQAAYEPEIVNTYLYDEALAYAQRVDLSEYGFPYNYYLIAFYTEDGNILLGTVIVGAEGESILNAGTYTAANGGLLMEGFELYIGEEEEYFFEGGDGEIVVGGSFDSGYTFDIEIADIDNNKFHFTYEGAVLDMDPFGALPSDPVNITVNKMIGEYYGTEYSETYNYYIVLSDLGFDADGYALAGGTYYNLDLYSIEGDIDADGFISIPAGTYTFDADDTCAEWTLGNYYSSYAKVNETGTAYDAQASFEAGQAVVTADSITLTVTIGGVEHTVVYTGAPKLYVGVQGGGGETGSDVNFTAYHAYAMYYGDQYTPGTADNYYFFLSDLGLDADGYDQVNGTYYRFDIYAPITSDYTITPGTYEIDVNDTMACGTVSAYYCAYYKWNSYGDDYDVMDWPDGGFITFNEDGSIYAEVHMMVSGQTHKISFNNGDIVIYDGTSGGGEGGGDYEGPYSTLTEDWRCNLSAHTLYYENYGDWYEVGYQNWTIAIMPNSEEGDFVQFDILAGADSYTSFAGEYTISNSLGSYTAYPGYVDYYLSGSWYYTNDGVTMAPLVDGWLDIVDNGDGTYTVEFDVYDDADYNITGKWTGEIRPASELMQATRSGSLKQYKSVVIDETVAPKNIVKEPLVAKRAQQNVTAAKGLKLR